MQVLLNTDHSVADFDTLSSHVDAVVSEALNHFRDQITRVEVHLGDENGKKSGPDDKRCMMEARLDHRPPVAVTYHANTVESSIHGAAKILAKSIDRVLGRDARARWTRERYLEE